MGVEHPAAFPIDAEGVACQSFALWVGVDDFDDALGAFALRWDGVGQIDDGLAVWGGCGAGADQRDDTIMAGRSVRRDFMRHETLVAVGPQQIIDGLRVSLTGRADVYLLARAIGFFHDAASRFQPGLRG